MASWESFKTKATADHIEHKGPAEVSFKASLQSLRRLGKYSQNFRCW